MTTLHMDDWMERHGIVVKPPADKRCAHASHRDFEKWAEETVEKLQASEAQNRANPTAARVPMRAFFRCDYFYEESGKPAFTPKLRRVAEEYPDLQLSVEIVPPHKDINLVVIKWSSVANDATVPQQASPPSTAPVVDLPVLMGTEGHDLKFDGEKWSV